MADALRLDFALIHKDRARAGPQGHNRPYSGMPPKVANGPAGDDEDCIGGATTNAEGLEEEMMMASISSLNEGGQNGDIMNTAVSVVANHEGEESTITLVGDVKGKVVFLTASDKYSRRTLLAGRTDLIYRMT